MSEMFRKVEFHNFNTAVMVADSMSIDKNLFD